jgi:membrane protease YdiL (CAAX protease family)
MTPDPESQLPAGPDQAREPSRDSPTAPHNSSADTSSPAASAIDRLQAGASPVRPELPALAGDPILYAAVTIPQPVEYPLYALELPDDLHISWSWWHLLLFVCAAVASPFVIPLVMALAIAAYTHDSAQHIQAMFANPGFLIAAQLLLFAALFFFLYITLAVLREAPFWRTLGWRKLSDRVGNRKPWMFLAWGSGLALFVAVASSRVKGTENAPIEELFKDPHSAPLLMAMAVFVAPLVEETVFRGYLYPLFAGGFSRAAARLGMDSPRAVRFGMTSGILLTGFLFGIMHGSQLGWNWSLVSLLTLVGVLFTFARATTGTVVASFLMHLGYNSLIAVSSILATKGFQHMPPGH